MRAINNIASCLNLNLIAGLTLIISLAACGGGSSSSSSGNGITLPTAPVTITPTNAPQVAGAAVDAAFGGTSLPIGVQTSTPASATSSIATSKAIAKIGQKYAQQIISQSPTPTNVAGVVTTSNCIVSGTMSVDATSATSGSITFNNCSDMAGETINGTMSMSGYSSTPPTEAFDVVYNLTIATTLPANTLTAKGDMHLVINLTTGAMTMTGASLSMGNTDATMGNFGLQNYTIAFDASGNATTMTFTYASTAINGTATFAMTTPFIFGTGMFPSSGAATISGANSTKLKLTVLGDETALVSSQVQLELSTNNGTTYGTPTLVTWASISSNL